MAKPYLPTLTVIIRRSFDGEVEGERAWSVTSTGEQIDKLEDCIAFVMDAAKGQMRYQNPTDLGKSEGPQ